MLWLSMVISLFARAEDDSEFDFGIEGGYQASLTDTAIGSSPSLSLHATWQFADYWGVELKAGRTEAHAPDPFDGDVEAYDPRLELQYYFADRDMRVRPFVGLAGGVYGYWERTSWLADVGPSLEINLAPILDFRVGARFRVVGASTEPVVDMGEALLVDAGFQIHDARQRDLDGDGIVGKADACPEVPEDMDSFEDADGCPESDNDKDGIADAQDRCANEPEDMDSFEDTDGCPDPDNDGDGLVDTADKCPGDAEDKDAFEDEDGCPDPDNDKDGVLDADDKCPAEMETMNGYKDRDGCADEVPAAVQKFSGRIEGIKFDTGKATLTKGSFVVLDAAVKVLTDYPDVRLEVQGHTDDVGDDKSNMDLSQARTESVVAYFTAKGIAADRLVAKGYGETVPEVPNTDKASRARNRRVEFKLLQ
jgi:outer membrane protein OmpA-like peptidoglycan-associated protein